MLVECACVALAPAMSDARSRGDSSRESTVSDATDSKRARKPGSSRQRTASELARALHTKLGGEAPLSLSAHQSATTTLAKLRERLIDRNQELSPSAQDSLLCAGVMAHRRATRSARIVKDIVSSQIHQEDDDDEENVNKDELGLLSETSKLIFVVLCVLKRRHLEVEDGIDFEQVNAQEIIEDDLSLEPLMMPRPSRQERKRAREGDDGAEHGKRRRTDGDGDIDINAVSRWRRVLMYRPVAEIESSALEKGAAALALKDMPVMAARIHALFQQFYRAAASRLALKMLLPDGDRDFCSLDAACIAKSDTERAEKLLNIVQAGESEAGQGVARALVLSLCLPASIVGVRRTLLLSREAYTAAGVDHPKVVERAHNCAMAGVEWIWEHSDDDVERSVSLLTGLAMMTTRGGSDPIRKVVAFGGRLQIPFLEVPPPNDPAALRILFVPEHQRWVLYKLDRNGNPSVQSSQRGFEGLCNACLLMSANLR